MIERAILVTALFVATLAVPSPAGAFECLGLTEPVCFAYYEVIVEHRDGHILIGVYEKGNDKPLIAVCIEPPYVWIGNCATPPGPPPQGSKLLA